MRLLQDLVIATAGRFPEYRAIQAPEGPITYAELDRLANQAARALAELGVGPGDRVAIWADKSFKVVVAMQAILRLGAAYVPIDPQSPYLRAASIIRDCKVKTVVTNRVHAEELLTGELSELPCLSVDGGWQGFGWEKLRLFSDEPLPVTPRKLDDLAYILYTSGSTGQPKGVCISHRNALAFVDWAVETIKPTPEDRFSSHAPFHFDLSVLDLYAAFSVGASVHLIPERISYLPRHLVEFLMREGITIWYSVPSALILMLEHGELLENAGKSPIRTLLFAGEPFPIKHLRRIRDAWPATRFLNLYGPTETNVCTYYEVRQIHPKRTTPVPIGIASCGNSVWAMKADGTRAMVAGEEGELFVGGPTVMLGYWGHPPQGEKPYATGDIVRIEDDGNFVYIGRRDHMVKIRGYRIELGDIEAALLELPQVREVAVIVSGSGMDAKLVAFIVARSDAKPGLIEVKRHCSKRLPRYMIIDEVRYLEPIPRTSTGKVDKKALGELAEERSSPVPSKAA